MFGSRIPSRADWPASRRSVRTPITVTQISPTFSRAPIGASVVKNRLRTPWPMMATGSPRWTCIGLNQLPELSSRFVRRKYVVSTPTTFPERRSPSRVMEVLRTISAAAASTAGMPAAIATASA